MLFRRSGSELFDTFTNVIFLRIFPLLNIYLSLPGIIDARARYRAAARRLRNTGVGYGCKWGLVVKVAQKIVYSTFMWRSLCASNGAIISVQHLIYRYCGHWVCACSRHVRFWDFRYCLWETLCNYILVWCVDVDIHWGRGLGATTPSHLGL
jgi:hypothetical protein